MLAASLLVLFPACGGKKAGEKDEKGAKSLFKKALQKSAVVTTYEVSSKEVPLVITEDGKSQASDRYQAKAPGSVKVQKIFVEEGARVQPGDPLVKFNDETVALRLNVARAEIREAEAGIAAFNQAEPRKEAPQPAQPGQVEGEGDNGVSQEVAPNEARNQLYQAQLDRAKAQVELFEKITELDQLNSPIAGIAGKSEVGEGSSAAEDQTLIEIVKLDPILFVFNIDPDQTAYLEKGGEIAVKFAAMPGQEFTAEVGSIGSEAGSNGSGVEVKLKIANPDLTIKSELKGTVEIRTAARRKIVTVPESAIVKTERSAYVYKVAGNKADRVAVDLGTSNGGQVEIEKGLADGDVVIVSAESGMESLSDGAPIEVQATRAEK